MKALLGLIVVAALAIALAAIPVAASGTNTPTTSATQLRTSTQAIGRPHRLRPGMRLTMPTVYRGQRIAHYQWFRCNRAGVRCIRIRAASHRVYVVRLADVGHTLRARIVTWQGSTVVTTAPSPQVGRPLPVNTAVPTITDGGQGGGSLSGPIVGDVLTGSNGSWQHAMRFTYQWMDCDAAGANCVPITGATTQAYTLQDSDAGSTIVFQVTAYNF